MTWPACGDDRRWPAEGSTAVVPARGSSGSRPAGCNPFGIARRLNVSTAHFRSVPPEPRQVIRRTRPAVPRLAAAPRGAWLCPRCPSARVQGRHRFDLSCGEAVLVDVVPLELVAEAGPLGHCDEAAGTERVAGCLEVGRGRVVVHSRAEQAAFVVLADILAGR